MRGEWKAMPKRNVPKKPGKMVVKPNMNGTKASSVRKRTQKTSKGRVRNRGGRSAY